MSAALCMAGLFPPQGHQIWNPNVNWQPVPIHTVAKAPDHLFYPWTECERFNDTWDKVENSAEMKLMLAKNKTLLNYLSAKTGDKLKTLNDCYPLYDRLSVGRSKSDWYVSILSNWH